MAGFRLIDRFIASDGINVQTRKLFVPPNASSGKDVAIGDLVEYFIDTTPTPDKTFDTEKGLNGRYVRPATQGTTGAQLAGVVVGFTSLSDPLSNSSGIVAETGGFVIVNTGLDLVYSGILDAASTALANIVGSNIGFTFAEATNTNGIFESQMLFDASSIASTPALPFRIEWADADVPTGAIQIYARLKSNELNFTTGITPA